MRDQDPLPADTPEEATLELSIVMPCLNEAETIEECIRKANRALLENGIWGEVVVADNGSTDGSREIARKLAARVVLATEKGYGSALMAGIAAAHGTHVLMGDADDSYDFGEAPRFLEKLREGCDLVQGCRLESCGGRILRGAMPFLHRWLGNPLFSYLARRWFRVPIRDIHCGLRAFRRDLIREIDLRCTGMEFASEMVIKATLRGARIAEIPITLRKDGRVSRSRHLRTFRDGWRHLRFFLLLSPRRLFLIPGELLILFGLAGYAVAMPQLSLRGVTFDVHTLLFASLAIICGYQSILFAVFTKVFAITEKLLPEDPRMTRLFAIFNLEKGLLGGALMTFIGLALLVAAINQWRVASFGPLNYDRTMRWVIPGVTLFVLGFQTILSSFFLSILGMQRRCES
jgi:glycosyltransferase involved in cell wall biosynthesis